MPRCLTEGDENAFACSSGAPPSVPPIVGATQLPGPRLKLLFLWVPMCCFLKLAGGGGGSLSFVGRWFI